VLSFHYKFIFICRAEPESQRPHPAAPSELQKSFSDFVRRFEASSSSSSSGGKKGGGEEAFGEFWEAPARFWRPRIREIEDGEIDAISVCDFVCIWSDCR
jgi:small subunit ribosomal protein YMR-31